MAVRDWAIPLGVGVAIALLAFFILSGGRFLDRGAGDKGGWPFDEGRALPGQTNTFLVVSAQRQTKGAGFAPCPPAGPDASPDPNATVAVEWLARSVGQAVRAPQAGDCGPVVHPVSSDSARFGPGWRGVRATLYAFTEKGRLLASNALEAEQERFDKDGDFRDLPAGQTWYLGDGAVPAGMVRLDRFADQTRDLMAGLPEGAVATGWTDQYSWLVGRIFVAVRIDALAATD